MSQQATVDLYRKLLGLDLPAGDLEILEWVAKSLAGKGKEEFRLLFKLIRDSESTVHSIHDLGGKTKDDRQEGNEFCQRATTSSKSLGDRMSSLLAKQTGENVSNCPL